MSLGKVTIFGGSQPLPGEPAYVDAEILGRDLAEAGFTILTGGYIGTMEAASKGAAEAGGHVIGITCAEIEIWRQVGANPWVQEEVRYPTLRERMYALIESCDAAVALPGGIGTLAEIAVMWSQMQTNVIPHKPFYLVGVGWHSMVEVLFELQGDYIAEKYRDLLQFVPDVETVVGEIKNSLLKD